MYTSKFAGPVNIIASSTNGTTVVTISHAACSKDSGALTFIYLRNISVCV